MAATGGRTGAMVVLAVVGLAVVGAAAATVHYRIAIAERVAREVLADAAVGPVSLRIEALEIDHAIVADLDVPALGATARRVRVDFAVGELLDRHIRRIHAQDLSVALDMDAGLPALAAPGGRSDGLDWSAAAILVDGSRYESAAAFEGHVLPAGMDAVPVSGRLTVRGTPAGLDSATIDAVAPAPPLPLIDAREARIRGTLDGDTLTLRAGIALAGGRLDLGFEGPWPATPDPANLVGVLTLKAQNPDLPLLAVQTAEATATLGATSVTVAGTLSAEEGTVTLAAEAARPTGLTDLPRSLHADVGFRLLGVHVPQAPGPIDATGRLRFDMDGTAAEVRVREDVHAMVHMGGEPISATLAAADAPLVRSENVFDAEAPLAVRVDEATLRAMGETLSFLGLDGEIRPGPAPAVTVRAARLDANRPGFAPPVDVEGHGTLDGDAIRFEGRASALDGVVAVRLRGRHDLGTSDGTAEVALQRIDFIPSLLQPGDLSGAFPAVITDVRGGIAAEGSLSWGSGGLASDLVIGLHRIGFAAEGALVEGVTGSVTLDRPWPPRTPPGQTVKIERVVAGLPMTGGIVRFHVDDVGRLHVADAGLDVFGGRVTLADLVLDPDGVRQTATVRIEGIGIQSLIDFAELEGTSGTGTFAGILPVVVSADGVSVAGGRLEAAAPGVLRYAPAVPPAALQGGGEGVSLMLEALKDFRYDVLRADIDGEAGGEWTAALHLAGKNPNFLDGYPFELNFNFSGKLDAILREGMKGFSLPERVGEGISGTRP